VEAVQRCDVEFLGAPTVGTGRSGAEQAVIGRSKAQPEGVPGGGRGEGEGAGGKVGDAEIGFEAIRRGIVAEEAGGTGGDDGAVETKEAGAGGGGVELYRSGDGDAGAKIGAPDASGGGGAPEIPVVGVEEGIGRLR